MSKRIIVGISRASAVVCGVRAPQMLRGPSLHTGHRLTTCVLSGMVTRSLGRAPHLFESELPQVKRWQGE